MATIKIETLMTMKPKTLMSLGIGGFQFYEFADRIYTHIAGSNIDTELFAFSCFSNETHHKVIGIWRVKKFK